MRAERVFNQGCIIAVTIYFLLAGIFYYAAGSQLFERTANKQIQSQRVESVTGEFAQG